MNYLLNSIPKPVQIGIVIVLGAVLFFFLWYKGTQLWNGIGNFFFHRQINAERVKVQKELDDAVEQKKQFELTLQELAVAKKDYADAKAEKDRLEGIFNDQSKSAAAKVAAFKAAVADDPVNTPTDNVTTEDLCARAKAIGASAATVAAVCGR